MNIDKTKFEEQGFLLVKNVLNLDEVETLRALAYATIANDEETRTLFMHRFAKNHLGCLTNIEGFKNLILDDNVIKIAEKLLGGTPAYFGDSILEIGIGSRVFHKDTSERKNQNHPDWTEPYPILRIAFYLEDHDQYSGGLKVRIGSNNTVSTKKGKALIIPSQAGDAIVFSLRVSHAGNAVRLKAAPNLSLHNSLEKRVPNILRLPEEKERVSIFLTFGLRSKALDRYMNFMFNHKIYQRRIEESNYPENLVTEIKEKVDFINIKVDKKSTMEHSI